MERRMRTEILIRGERGLAARLAAQARETELVEEVEAPNEGLVMLKLRETARNGLFYLGEVLVTEAKAMIRGRIGLGMVRGSEPQLARDLAVIDAAYMAAIPQTVAWEALLVEEATRVEKARAAADAISLSTKVDFHSMDRTVQQ